MAISLCRISPPPSFVSFLGLCGVGFSGGLVSLLDLYLYTVSFLLGGVFFDAFFLASPFLDFLILDVLTASLFPDRLDFRTTSFPDSLSNANPFYHSPPTLFFWEFSA